MQIPTPTPLPAAVSPITMPDISLWDSAPTAISFWNHATFAIAVTALQGIIIIGLALAIIAMLQNIINEITTDD